MNMYPVYTIDDEFSLTQTFSCGQCFRWEMLGEETWRGTAFSRFVTLSLRDQTLYADCTQAEFDSLWRGYLDLDRDYAAIRRAVSVNDDTEKAVRYGAGIRILRQEPWETLCSFLLSQCNNIPRIRGIIDRLCCAYGEELSEGEFAFPQPERLINVDEAELRDVIRCGYRAPYLISAARHVADGSLDLAALCGETTADAEKALLSLPGVGKKVANCVLLFGLRKTDAFPMDVWMRRAVDAFYGKDFDPAAVFGAYAGFAQQYLFFYALNRQL